MGAGADCKSAANRLAVFDSQTLHHKGEAQWMSNGLQTRYSVGSTPITLANFM